MTEQDIQKKILSYLNELGYFFKTIHTNKRGVPDIIGTINGKFIGIEVKQPGGKPTELQKRHIEFINGQGGVAFVATSVEDVKINFRLKGLIK